ncbi:MAG TPA: DivIVA domain-containing protein [Ilumatobacteraceae bacterium]
MDFSPQTVRSAGFKTVKKGYDQAEVDDFKEKVAAAIETAQNQATAMEARARAAVAKLQEVSQQVTSGSREPGAAPTASDEDAEIISRTLLLAQRTADATVNQANADAESITVKARVDATTIIDNARAMADKLLDEARVEARRSAESERIKAENEVQSLLARRDFLLSDVDHLEHHLDAQRERLRDAAVSLQELIERVPGGLGELRRPLLSASAESTLPAPSADAAVAPDAVNDETQAMSYPAETTDERTSDSTPAQLGETQDSDDDSGMMHLDLELGREPATTPRWSASGDPLILGDELQ